MRRENSRGSARDPDKPGADELSRSGTHYYSSRSGLESGISFVSLPMTQPATAEAAATLDTIGLLCPLPVLKARRALKPLAPGAVLEVLATDPGAVKDFEHFCRTTGCELLESFEEPGGVLRFRIKKPG
jgi:tRNA 2-thiouridine synthesizing protein A